MNRIRIQVGELTLAAELNDSPTAQQVWDALPFEGRANTWGDEIYFGIPVDLEEAADAQAEVDVGTLAYWPPGKAFCVFFGPTPVSSGAQPCAASPVNVFGQVSGDVTTLRQIPPGATVKVTAAD
jgi:uncharacterized protein